MAKNKKERRALKNEKRATKNERKIRAEIINAQAQKEVETEVASVTTNTEIQKEIEDKKGIEQIWGEICAMVKTLSETSKKTLPEIWNYVRDKEIQQRTRKGLTETDETIIKMLRDESYFSEVEYVTEFKYLMEDALIAKARLGYSSRKFKSADNYDRYSNLKKHMRSLSDNEEIAISRLLSRDIDSVTRRILEQRSQVIEKQKQMREGTYDIGR